MRVRTVNCQSLCVYSKKEAWRPDDKDANFKAICSVSRKFFPLKTITSSGEVEQHWARLARALCAGRLKPGAPDRLVA